MLIVADLRVLDLSHGMSLEISLRFVSFPQGSASDGRRGLPPATRPTPLARWDSGKNRATSAPGGAASEEHVRHQALRNASTARTRRCPSVYTGRSSLLKMLPMCLLMAASLRNKCAARLALERPSAIRLSTSFSRALSRPQRIGVELD